MSSASLEPRDTRGRSASLRAALVAAALVVVVVVAIAVAHAVHSSPGAAARANASPGAMNMSTHSAGTASPRGVMTIHGASLPTMQSSGAMPAAMTMVPLGQTVWEGMKIETRTSAPATFILFNGTSQQLVKPTSADSFHLMVMLSDAYTGYAIPYSSVWATITKGSKLVYDERLWPMVSRYMGPHYGNNVALPSAGLYRVSLLVSPPMAARHLEYKGLWLKPHRVRFTFRWVPKT